MFSVKYEYKKEPLIQIETVSERLRQRIWNLYYQSEIRAGGLKSERLSQSISGTPLLEDKIVDALGFNISNHKTADIIENYLLKESEWYEIYDFIEIHLSFLAEEKKIERIDQYNILLEQEKSGYRVIAGEVSPITNPLEIESIDAVIESSFDSVSQHMKKALELYSDRETPDYENSIKESISAVEAMCCIISGKSGKGATLGAIIKKLPHLGLNIHPAMLEAFSKLYGYASDGDIRHGTPDFTNVPVEDAKFMLVSCSAFVNFLIEKWSKKKD